MAQALWQVSDLVSDFIEKALADGLQSNPPEQFLYMALFHEAEYIKAALCFPRFSLV